MKRKSAWLSFTACALTAASVLTPLRAEPPTGTAAKPDFSNVQVVAFSDGNVGFFEKSTGTLYIYDSRLSACLSVRKITQLGENMEILKPFPIETARRRPIQ